MLNSIVLCYALVVWGIQGFTPRLPLPLTRISLVGQPFYVGTSTELESDDEASEVSTSLDDEESVAKALGALFNAKAPPPVDVSGEGETSGTKRVIRTTRDRNTLFLGNIPFEMSDNEIGDLFKEYGTVLGFKVPRDRITGRPRGFAFVDMSTKEELETAIAGLDGTLVKGRSLRASHADATPKSEKVESAMAAVDKVYVGNLPFGTSKEALLEFFNDFCDPVEAYIPVEESSGLARGFAFVTLKTEDIDEVIEKTNGMEFNGRTLVVSRPLPPGQRSQRKPPAKDRIKLYVGNLAFTTDAQTLEEVFGEFGEVYDCYLPPDTAVGGRRGFGFLTMARENAMQAIAELNGCELDGRFIRVNEAMPKGRMPTERDDDEDY